MLAPKALEKSVKVTLRDEVSLEIDNIDMEEKPLKQSGGDGTAPQEAEGFDDGILLSQIKPKWPMIIAHIQKIRVAVAAHLGRAILSSSSGATLCLGYTKKDLFHRESIESEKNRAFIEKVITEAVGKKVVIKLIELNTPGVQPAVIAPKPVPEAVDTLSADAGSDSDSFVNEILDAFNGKIHTDS